MTKLHRSRLLLVNENWKDIQGYEGYYQVSDFERVRSLDRVVPQAHTVSVRVKGKIKSYYIANTTGYKTVSLRKERTHSKITIHVLVATCFVDGWFEGAWINHKDGNKMNCRPNNLEWCTPSQNVQHATELGLNKTRHAYMANAKKVIDISTGKIYESIAEAGKIIGMKTKTISNMLTGHRANRTALRYFD